MKQEIKNRIEQINRGEVPEGYDKKIYGITPIEWKEITLGEVCEKCIEKNSKMEYKTVFTNSAEFGIIAQGDFFKKDIANAENISGYYIVDESDFIYNPRISKSAPCGPININLLDKKGIVSPLYTVFKLNNDNFSIKYLQQYFDSKTWHNYARSIANYGARSDRMNITSKEFFNMPLLNLRYEEQNKIAEILMKSDELINLQVNYIKQLELRNNALVQKLLSPRSSWIGAQLNELFNRHVKKNTEGNSNVLTISAQHGLINQQEYFNKEIASSDKSNYYLMEEDDFAYNKSYSKGYSFGAIKRLTKYKKGIVSPLYICFRIKDVESIGYWTFYFESKLLGLEISKVAQEGARNHGLLNIGVKDFFNCKVYYPAKKAEQERIANILSKADEEISLNKQKLDKLREQKRSLMQLLLTGIVRVV